ncbi:MAG TPA: cadmium-translocating P-type ATPase [Polyangiaceae bacterium]|nr:cadmium-translocating P-type ATPase [Polyangiaceae bacterium]
MATILLELDKMWCTSCARACERVLQRVPGVATATVGFGSAVATLEVRDDHDPASVAHRAAAATDAMGYPARPFDPSPASLITTHAPTMDLPVRVAIGALLGMWVMALQIVLYVDPTLTHATRTMLARAAGVLSTPVVFVVGWPFIVAGWRTLRAGVAGLDVLVSAGAIGAWGLSVLQLVRGVPEVWFDAAAMLVVFLSAGRLLDQRARHQGADAVRDLLALAPDRVQRLQDGGTEEVPAAEIRRGDRIAVAPGERFALDGSIREGSTVIDRSALTGEALPVAAGPGGAVFAAEINGDGPVVIEVEGEVGQRRVDQIARTVRIALGRRSEVPTLGERVAEHLVPVIMALAVATGVGAWWLGGDPEAATLRALTVLVVSCPCALGVSAPLVSAVAIGRAASHGVLFRDGDALRRLAEIDLVAFDKTGTLTEGSPVIVGIDASPPGTTEALLYYASIAEAGAAHPIAKALRRDDGDDAAAGGEHRTVPGSGIEWRATRRTASPQHIRVGSRRWLGAGGWPEAPGQTEAWVEVDGTILGRVRLTDALRSDAVSVARHLRAHGLGLRLWSGDAAEPVAQVAQQLGLSATEVHAQSSPEDKSALATDLQRQGHRIAFVGDGVNDAPALAAADVGIAMGEATDAARAAAAVVIRGGGLAPVVRAIAIARSARGMAQRALIWAVSYNAIAVPVAMLGWIEPQWAALAMVGSSLTVTAGVSRWASRELHPPPGPARR